MSPGQTLPGQMLPLQLESVLDVPRNLTFKGDNADIEFVWWVGGGGGGGGGGVQSHFHINPNLG